MPHFVIKNKFQKKAGRYEDLLTSDILSDVCFRITGRKSYTVEFDDSGYNMGRLAILEHSGSVSYISFSENQVASRNSSLQSFPSALLRFHQEASPRKQIFFYFLPSVGDSIETPYFIFMYRLMKSAGTRFLNDEPHLKASIVPFNSVGDIIAQRNANREYSRSNNPTYLTIDENNTLQIFGKTYGASKYETTLLCLAISAIATTKIELYEVQEGGLKTLPALAKQIILGLGNIQIIRSDLTLERAEFEKNDSLRSPAYMFNLLEKLGDKKCGLCDCEIPQIIQGAHIWPVASIKKAKNIDPDQRLEYAVDGDNGIWLCSNHHKLFDANLLLIREDGTVHFKTVLRPAHENYLNDVTVADQIRVEILTPKFVNYLRKRNTQIDSTQYRVFNRSRQ